ncbi:MAG: hypothetical protein ACRD3V_05375, partial [Vicinamibacteria bacterium]
MNTSHACRWPVAVAASVCVLAAASCGRPDPAAAAEPREESRPASFWSELWAFGEESVTLPAETPVRIRLEQRISSETHTAGERFEATLAAPLSAEGKLLALAGAPVWGELTEVDEGGKVKGKARLTMTLRGLEVAGERHELETGPLTIVTEGSLDEDAKVIGGSSAVGAIIGAITGGKKGAAIGAGVGAAGGTGYVLATKGEQVTFGPGAIFRFMLLRPLELPM